MSKSKEFLGVDKNDYIEVVSDVKECITEYMPNGINKFSKLLASGIENAGEKVGNWISKHPKLTAYALGALAGAGVGVITTIDSNFATIAATSGIFAGLGVATTGLFHGTYAYAKKSTSNENEPMEVTDVEDFSATAVLENDSPEMNK